MAEPVRVRVLNVGQGDAIVGILPGGNRAFVVDVFDADKVLDFLAKEGIVEVVLFLSHSDRDHTAGASDFLVEYRRTGRILGIFYNHDRLTASYSGEYVRLTRLIGRFSRDESRTSPDYLYENFNTNLNRYADFARLFPPGCLVRVVHPEQADQSCLIGQNTNETAGVLMVEWNGDGKPPRRMLLAADVQLTGISLMLSRESSESLTADVLKFPHHGAWPDSWPGIRFAGVQKRSLADFLIVVQPFAVVISTGFENPYGHVRAEVFSLLEQHQRSIGNLTALKCTQFTGTCLAQQSLPENGTFSEPHCAGDVEVVLGSEASDSGVEVNTFPADHVGRVALLDKIGHACCAFLSDTAVAIRSTKGQ